MEFGLNHGITSKHFLSSWPGVFRAWPVDISGICIFFHVFPRWSRLVPSRFVSWALEAFRSLSGERDRLGSKDGWFGMGIGGKDADFAWLFASKICPTDFGSVNIERWMNSCERPSGNAEFCQAHGVWRPQVSWMSFTGAFFGSGSRLVPLLLYQSFFGRCYWIVELPPWINRFLHILDSGRKEFKQQQNCNILQSKSLASNKTHLHPKNLPRMAQRPLFVCLGVGCRIWKWLGRRIPIASSRVRPR